VGIDAGRQSHHAAAVDEHGQVLWSMRVSNDQDALTELLGKVETGGQVSWAVDLIGCETGAAAGRAAGRRPPGDLCARPHGQVDERCVRG
jgi:hypothetical protein